MDPILINLVLTILSFIVGAIANHIYHSLTMNDMRLTMEEASRIMLNLRAALRPFDKLRMRQAQDDKTRLEAELEQLRKGVDNSHPEFIEGLAKVNFGE